MKFISSVVLASAIAVSMGLTASAANSKTIADGAVTIHGIVPESPVPYIVPADIYAGEPEKTVTAQFYQLDASATVVYDRSVQENAFVSNDKNLQSIFAYSGGFL